MATMLASAVHWLLLAAVGAGVLASVALLCALPATPRLSRQRDPSPSQWPRVSVIVPARDEERAVEDGVGSHLAHDYPESSWWTIARATRHRRSWSVWLSGMRGCG